MSDEQEQPSTNHKPVDPHESFLSGIFIPSNPQKPTEQKIVRQTIVDNEFSFLIEAVVATIFKSGAMILPPLLYTR